MSEYIVKVEGQIPDAIYERQLGEIVRCRDCKRFKPREGATLNCRFEHPSMPNTFEWCYAEPDGFCAWGERKENE